MPARLVSTIAQEKFNVAHDPIPYLADMFPHYPLGLLRVFFPEGLYEISMFGEGSFHPTG